MTARRHHDVIARIEGLNTSLSDVAILGPATDYPMLCVHFGVNGTPRRRVLITGGVHGDEPAGVEAVLQFLETMAPDYVRHFQFTVIPCVNPSGFEADTRENGAGQDINRAMSDDGVVASVTLRQAIAGQHYDLFFDCHEDYEATGFYMCEVERQDRLLGAAIVEAVKQIGPIDSEENTDEGLDMPVSEGLFKINPVWRTTGWSAYAYFESADHGVLTETPPMAWPLQSNGSMHTWWQ